MHEIIHEWWDHFNLFESPIILIHLMLWSRIKLKQSADIVSNHNIKALRWYSNLLCDIHKKSFAFFITHTSISVFSFSFLKMTKSIVCLKHKCNHWFTFLISCALKSHSLILYSSSWSELQHMLNSKYLFTHSDK